MDSAKYLKRKVKAGTIDVHPTEKALVVNYELEATILGELGDPMLGERKECQKIIRLKYLDASSDIEKLSKEIVSQCNLIHSSKLSEVQQLLFYLINRKEITVAEFSISSDSGSALLTFSEANSSNSRYSPVTVDQDLIANINDLEDYVELLYDDVNSKIHGAAMILQLCRNPNNLEELSGNETLLGALSRVLREDWSSSNIELATNIIYIFFCFSAFSCFHESVVARYKIGSFLVSEILPFEVDQYNKWKKDDKLEQLADHISRQEQELRVAVYLLLNIAEDPKTEEKMCKKNIVPLLSTLLSRKNLLPELLVLILSLLKRLSIYAFAKDEMASVGVIEYLCLHMDAVNTQATDDVTHCAIRLLLNLSFDAELRRQMIRWGLLPRLVVHLSTTINENDGPLICLLYHLSIDDKVKSMFSYTDAIPILMKRILDSGSEVDLETLALSINLAANKRNAQLICQGHGLRILIQRAFMFQDILMAKLIRTIAHHEGETKNLFVEFIGDIAAALQRADKQEFVIECLGILGSLTISNLDFERLLREYSLIPWLKERLDEPILDADDLLLEVVIFLGTCCSDACAAKLICQEGLVERLIQLFKLKLDDEEMILQTIYCFYQICTVSDWNRSFLCESTDAKAYLIEFMHDPNLEIRRICCLALDTISINDSTLADRVRKEKFRFYNKQWLEVISNVLFDKDSAPDTSYGEEEFDRRSTSQQEFMILNDETEIDFGDNVGSPL